MVKFNFKLNSERKLNINFNINFNISFNHAHRKYVILMRKYILSVKKSDTFAEDIFLLLTCSDLLSATSSLFFFSSHFRDFE
jgi:hypothetical protein